MEYRRRTNSDVWHFHGKCRWWPQPPTMFRAARQVVEGWKPTSGELCDECLSKTRRGVPDDPR